MVSEPRNLPWEAPGWTEAAWAWVAENLGAAGIRVDGELVEHQRRAWSLVFTIDSSQGRLFFKAVNDALRHEVGLHQALFAAYPDAVPPLVAADRDRGWLLIEDAGLPLRGSVRSVDDLDQFAASLVRMAQLQISWLSNAQVLLDLGAMDRRPESLPVAFARLIDDERRLASQHSENLADDDAKRLVDLSPRVDELCRRLASWGPAPTLHHDDFHDANIFVNNGRINFADWGEAGVGHPFLTPMIALRVLAWRLELAPDSPPLAKLVDAYLEVWEPHGPRSQLRRAYDLAQRLAPISRALTWHRVMSAVPARLRGEDATAAAGWLRTALATLDEGTAPSSPP